MLDRILLVKKFGFCNEEFHDYFSTFSCSLTMCEKITFIVNILRSIFQIFLFCQIIITWKKCDFEKSHSEKKITSKYHFEIAYLKTGSLLNRSLQKWVTWRSWSLGMMLQIEINHFEIGSLQKIGHLANRSLRKQITLKKVTSKMGHFEIKSFGKMGHLGYLVDR